MIGVGLDGVERTSADGRTIGDGLDHVQGSAGDGRTKSSGLNRVATAPTDHAEIRGDAIRVGDARVVVRCSSSNNCRSYHSVIYLIYARSANEVGRPVRVRLNPQSASAVPAQLQSLIVRRAEKINSRRRVAVAVQFLSGSDGRGVRPNQGLAVVR